MGLNPMTSVLIKTERFEDTQTHGEEDNMKREVELLCCQKPKDTQGCESHQRLEEARKNSPPGPSRNHGLPTP